MVAVGYERTQTDELLRQGEYDLLDEYRQAIAFAELEASGRVLDVATGSGRMLHILTVAGLSVCSGDINLVALERAGRRMDGGVGGHVTQAAFDAFPLPISDHVFTSVVCANGLHEMIAPRLVLQEMVRVCNPGGVMLIVDFSENGFCAIEAIHRQVHGRSHNRGQISVGEINCYLAESFNEVRSIDLPLNHVWAASRKVGGREI